MIKKLKPYGLHHALIMTVFAWSVCFLINPLWGMVAVGFGCGWYGGREEDQAERRGFNPLKLASYQLSRFEWKDFLVTWLLGAFYLFIMRGM